MPIANGTVDSLPSSCSSSTTSTDSTDRDHMDTLPDNDGIPDENGEPAGTVMGSSEEEAPATGRRQLPTDTSMSNASHTVVSHAASSSGMSTRLARTLGSTPVPSSKYNLSTVWIGNISIVRRDDQSVTGFNVMTL